MVEEQYIEQFEKWCEREHIRVIRNREVFFINERKTLSPVLRLGNGIFIYIVDGDILPEQEQWYQLFANSYQTIIVIPKFAISDFVTHVSRRDIVQHFKINL